jgi:hypothetical protein
LFPSESFWVVYVAFKVRNGSEVEENAHFEHSRSQIADQLLSIGGRQFFRRLDFDYHSMIDDHVETLPGNMPALVLNVD